MLNDFGFGFRSIGRGLKKVGKGVVKAHVKVGKGVVKAHVAVTKLALLLPLKIAVKATQKIGRILCKAPPQLLELAATQANVDPAFIPLFCAAVRESKISVGSVRRLLPPALKVASKLAAAGAFPPIVPVLAVVRKMPYISRFADAGLSAYASDLRNPALRPAVDAMEILALSDHLGLLDEADAEALGLTPADRAAMQGYLAASEADAKGSWSSIVLFAAMTGFGFYLITRKPL